jgi:U3 small nucleolar RNA-associated protein 21
MIVDQFLNGHSPDKLTKPRKVNTINNLIINKKRFRDTLDVEISSKYLYDENLCTRKENLSGDELNYKISKSLNKKYSIANLSNIQNQNRRLIEPYRTLGLVIDFNQVSQFNRNTDRYILCSNFNSFLLYNLDKIKLERISPPLPMKISAIAHYKNKVFTAIGNKILLWEKIHIVKEFSNFENKIFSDQQSFFYKKLVSFENLLLALTSTGNLHIFDIYTGKLNKEINLNIEDFIHPSTYLNKILFTKKTEQYEQDLKIGNTKLYLYNINTEKQIFEFDFNMKNSVVIKKLEQSPVIDVIGVGFSSGDIIIFNLKNLKKILKFKSEYPVDNLTFSNCVGLNMSLLASSTPKGDINLWDLNKNTLHHTISRQFTSVSSIIFLPNEPILVATSGKDNSIKIFNFEPNSGIPLLLKQRTGHSSHPKKIRFYGEKANNESLHILSISQNEFRNISLINEHMSRPFSINMKNLPNSIKYELKSNSKNLSFDLLSFDFNEFRERDWSNILVNMKGFCNPLLVSYENSVASDILAQVKSKSPCTSICVSMCGNFGFAGYEDGSIEKFNMQSGLNRWNIEKAHEKPIIGLKTDGINSMIISISLDNTLKFWDFFQSSLVKEIELLSTPDLLEINLDNDLIAVTLINSSIYIYDKSTFKLVREFGNKSSYNKINDITFTQEGKWLIVASEDKSLKIYDILSGNIIEWVSFKHIPASICISPNNQYIAISFVGLNGIYLWINRTLFVDIVDLEDVKTPIKFELPFYSGVKNQKNRKEIYEEELQIKKIREENGQKFIKDHSESAKLWNSSENSKLIQLSKENKLKFRILNHLEKIQEKNAPKIKRKEKTKAPFFLFNLNSLNGNETNDDTSPEFMNILKNYTHFKNEKMVNKNSENKKEMILSELLDIYSKGKVKSNEISSFLNSLNPYLIDLEIRNLDPLLNLEDGEENLLLQHFLNYINEEILGKNNFELIQAYLNRFLKVFSEVCMKDKRLKSKLEGINKEIENNYNTVDYLFNNTMCLISHFGKIQI